MTERTPEELREQAANWLRNSREPMHAEHRGLYETLADRTLQLADALEARDRAEAWRCEHPVREETHAFAVRRAEQAEAERDVLWADHDVNTAILDRLVMELPTAAGFNAGCENYAEVFDLVVGEHRRLRATLAAVREFPDTVRTLLKLECGDDGFVFWTDAEQVVRHHLLALLDGAAPEEGK